MNKITILVFMMLFAFTGTGTAQSPASETEIPFSSVSFQDYVLSTVVNPAGLYETNALNALFIQSQNELDTYSVMIGFRGIGTGLERGIRNGEAYDRYTASSGFRLPFGLSVGTGYSWFRSSLGTLDALSTWTAGMMYRPSSNLSAGIVFKDINSPTFNNEKLNGYLKCGIGLRPFGSDKFTVAYDIDLRDSSNPGQSLVFRVKPVDGISIIGSKKPGSGFGIGVICTFPQVGGGMFLDYSSLSPSTYKGYNIVNLTQDTQSSVLFPFRFIGQMKMGGKYIDDKVGMGRMAILTNSLRNDIEYINKIKGDETISGLLIRITKPIEADFSKVNELREAVENLRKTGKKVICYLETCGSLEYFLASAADHILVNNQAWINLAGLRSEVMFVKEMLAKVGIEADYEKYYEYKTAGDMYTESGLTDAFREMLDMLLDDYYDEFLALVAESRNISEAALEKIMDGGPYPPDGLLDQGLVDAVVYRDQVESIAAGLFDENPMMLDEKILRYRTYKNFDWKHRPKIAVVYAIGNIVPGLSSLDFFSGAHIMGSDTITRALKRARKDPTIRGVILRVDSPGGSALASDIIAREVELTRRKKPVVVSMSGVAASGGYYISAPADAIVAHPFTVTGSIGVIGGKFSFKGLYEKIGISMEMLLRGENSGLLSSSRKFTDKERKQFKNSLEYIYDEFVSLVAVNRGKTAEEVHAIAKGRVWTGIQAKKNGLIDDIGGLDRAIELLKGLCRIREDEEVETVNSPVFMDYIDLDKYITRIYGKKDIRSSLKETLWSRMLGDSSPLMLVPYSLKIR